MFGKIYIWQIAAALRICYNQEKEVFSVTVQEWETLFGRDYVVNLTNEERRYLALEPLQPEWETVSFCHRIEPSYHTRLTVFFSGNTIVKIIDETIYRMPDGNVFEESIVESDTRLQTEDREYVLPLTARGKPKKLTATSVRSVTPFGCTFHVQMMRSRKRGAVGGKVFLYNQRAKRDFPVGEQEEAAGIESDADFHAFMARYMATCPVDYFDRLEAFRRAEKVTIRYRVGDVFRMSYDRTHYCYGIITGEVKKVKALPEFPQVHSLRWTMMVPIMVRLYALETERADMTPEELRQYPLGRMIVCADNDIIWGNYPIIGHRSLTAEDIEFQLIPDVQKLGEGFADKVPFNVQVEWGLCSTVVPYRRIPEELRQKLIDLHYGAHYNGVLGGIPPEFALPEQHCAHWVMHQKNLLNPHNDALRGEILMLTGLPADADMDDFARAFGGLTRAEIAQRVQEGT